jgi:prepilin-type N-terminal cleavage/methylation domain-containing protein
MKNNKGFTIVELVIVIAVIAILAAVLIPTFSGVIQKANASAAQQQAASAEKVALSMSQNATLPSQTAFIIYNGDKSAYYYEYVNNKLSDTNKDDAIAMSIDTYTTTLGSIIVSVDYFLANGEETITPKTTATAASNSIESLVKKLADVNGIATQEFTDKTDAQTTYYTFTQNEDKTGYIFKYENLATTNSPALTDNATVITVFTSVDLNKDCLIFVPEYTKNS